MRKIVLALLVLLLTVPAMATVEVRCAQVSTTKQVVVTYDVDDGNNFRAFGIKISVDNGASISDIDVNDRDYYIFPGSIDINEAGDVNDWGSAIAAQTSNSFILEMGSLYAAEDPCHTTAPPASGQLCSFMVSGDCNVAIANDAARGGVVMEDLDFAGSIDLIGVNVDYVPCIPEGHPDYAAWVAAGEPECWCYTRQCHGDADGIAAGGAKTGYWYVGADDLTVLVAAWKVLEPTFGDGIDSVSVDFGGGKVVDGICADFDHEKAGGSKTGYWHVGATDLTILVNSWKVLEPTFGDGVDANCIDYESW
jgi:hypothetical protein